MTGEGPRDQWSASAASWARHDREEGPSAVATGWLIDAAALEPGDRVLELAGGSGTVGIQAAEAVGPDGRIVCSDFAPGMVDATRERVRALGLTNVEARVLDAEQLDVGEERFDAVICRCGYMLMNDPLRALRNSRAALADRGRLALAVWGAPERNPWLALIFDATMHELNAPPPPDGTPGPFALADGARLARLVDEAGFAAPRIEPLDTGDRHESLDQWWQTTVDRGGPLAMLLAQLPDATRDNVREGAFDRARAFVGEDGSVDFPGQLLAAAATRG